jgi:hypothetical protein
MFGSAAKDAPFSGEITVNKWPDPDFLLIARKFRLYLTIFE